MERNEILEILLRLSHSQGFYGRLYESLTDGSDDAEQCIEELENQNFQNEIDLILFIEG